MINQGFIFSPKVQTGFLSACQNTKITTDRIKICHARKNQADPPPSGVMTVSKGASERERVVSIKMTSLCGTDDKTSNLPTLHLSAPLSPSTL